MELNTEKLVMFTGIIFTLSILAVRIALGLVVLKISGKKLWILLCSYTSLFIFMSLLTEKISSYIIKIIQNGALVHALLALGLIIWGIYLLFHSQKRARSISGKLLLFPCPVCLSAIAMTFFFISNLFQLEIRMFSVFIGLLFSFIVFISFVIFKHIMKKKNNTENDLSVALMMIFIGLYLLGSLFVPSKIELAKEFYRNHQLFINFEIQPVYLFAFLFLFLILFIAGYIFGKYDFRSKD